MKRRFVGQIVTFSLVAATALVGVEQVNVPVLSPVSVQAATGSYTEPVTFVTNQGSRTGTFTSATDALGFQTVNPDGEDISLFGMRLGKRYLVAWADHEDVEQAQNVYFIHQTIGDVYPEGIPAGAKLYAVYGEISPFSMNELLGNNTAHINADLDAAATLPGTTILKDELATSRTVTGAYNDATDKYFVDLSASFKINRTLSLLTYVNKGGILTNSETEWNTNEGARFNHIDLHVSLPAQVESKDVLHFEFESNNAYPFAVMTDYGQPVEILDPATDLPVDLSTLSTKDSNKTAFKVRLNGAKNFIVRARPRSSGDYSKKRDAITTSELFQDYALRSLDKEAFWITKDTAAQMAENGTVATASGTVDGYAQPANMQTAIPAIKAQPLNIKFEKPVASDLYIGINKAGRRALKTDDGKAIFLIGNKFEGHFKDLEYTVYTNDGLTDVATENAPVSWKVEPVAGFERRRRVLTAANNMMQYANNTTSIYVAGQTNVNKATALVSGVYKVTVSLENGRNDYAYLVVPGDVDRSGTLTSNDASMLGSYLEARDLSSFDVQDEFTLLLANLDLNRNVSVTDLSQLAAMIEREVDPN